jgi:hypothetical protein
VFEKLPNFPHVTPAQLVHITFLTEGRYQPVCAVSAKAPPSVKNNKVTVAPAGSKSATAALGLASEKYTGGGGILILVDEFPNEEVEFVKFEAPIVGMVMFCQFWYWYPLAHCACFAFEPTGIIGLNADLKDFVHQGAFIALSMILVQQSEASSPSFPSTRALYTKVISDKHEDPMACFGAALSQGFIDAGGRNVTISLQSWVGSRNTCMIVGMVMFCQFWYWYPLAHCACFAFEPTGIIGLNVDLKDFVHQGAFIALGMILVQQSEASSPSLASTRALYTKIISDKHEDPMAHFGAALDQGFIDAGGQNITISLQSRVGGRNTCAIVGMVMFCQFWYWYPLVHCACFAFEPTGIIGLNADLKDFVRQGAFIALSMILVQQSEASSPSLTSTRALYTKVISDKHEDPMACFGAALGQGFIDAGGWNVTISLQSRAGGRNTCMIVGMVMFCQFWYWYPLAHCTCFAFEPTGIIGLNADLKVRLQ